LTNGSFRYKLRGKRLRKAKRIGYEILDLVKNDILKYSREGNIMIAGV
jgi:hypothetical protein